MTTVLENIHWFGKDNKLIGISNQGILITTQQDSKAILIENENIWWGYYEPPYFEAVNIAEWSD